MTTNTVVIDYELGYPWNRTEGPVSGSTDQGWVHLSSWPSNWPSVARLTYF